MITSPSAHIAVETKGHVALVELRRPPYNFFDIALLADLAEIFEAIDDETDLRSIVLAAEGKSFCAGADFSRSPDNPVDLYACAMRLFDTKKPIVAAIQGPAVGGGLGLALVPDFRIIAPEARFAANFVKLGLHPGFALTATLPHLIGTQRAAMLLYTGRRINAEEALNWDLADQLVPAADLRDAAMSLAAEIAEAAPLAVTATRATLRAGLAEALKAQTAHEAAEQTRLSTTKDFREGLKAVAERRVGRFIGA